MIILVIHDAVSGSRMANGKQTALYVNGRGTGRQILPEALIKPTKMVQQKNLALMDLNATKIRSVKTRLKALVHTTFVPKASV